MAETVAFSSSADEKLALELVAKRTQALKTRIAELEEMLREADRLAADVLRVIGAMDGPQVGIVLSRYTVDDLRAWLEARKVMEPSKGKRGNG